MTPRNLTIILLLTHSLAFAQAPPQLKPPSVGNLSFDFPTLEKGGTVTIKAGPVEAVQGDYVRFLPSPEQPKVEIEYQDVKITALEIRYNQKTMELLAEGEVTIDQGPRRLTGNRVEFNMGKKTGVIIGASASFEPSIYFRGERIEKVDEDTYRLTNGLFTSCDLDNPDWSFQVADGEITIDDYARLHGTSFRARKLPLFYLPYLVWPTKKDRSRGLLTPKIGYSDRFGAYLGTAYYVPFGPSADVTAQMDAFSKGFFGLGIEGRYRPDEAIAGRLETYLVRNPDGVSEGESEFEWKYTYTHTQDNLPGGIRGVVDVRDFSDLDFFRQYERKFEINTISNIYSSAYLTKNTSKYSMNLRADKRELLGGTTSRTFEQAPSLELRAYPNRIGKTPIYFSLESSAAHLRTSLGANYYRTDIFPTLSMRLKTPSWFSIKPQISVRETYYSSSYTDDRKLTDDAISRFYAQGQLEVVGPSFSRIFDLAIGGFDRFKHVIEPRFRYLYTTDVNEQNRLIQFDTVDTPVLPIVRDSVEYSLTQRFIGRESGASSREIASVSLRQTVALSKPFERLNVEGEQRFTPLTLNLRVNPYQSITLDANASFGNVSHQIDRTSVSANVTDAKRNRYMGLTWFASFLSPGQTQGDSSQFRVSTGAPIWKDKLRTDLQINYDAKKNDFLEQRYLVSYNASCYGIAVEFRDFIGFRATGVERVRDYTISINLQNVGTFVDLRGSLDSIF